MQFELIKAPRNAFLLMLLNNIHHAERKLLEDVQWGAVGLI